MGKIQRTLSPHIDPFDKTSNTLAMPQTARLIRDARNRFSLEANEVKRRALLYIARNTMLESQVRHRAQLQLHNMDTTTVPTRIRHMCLVTGKGRGVYRTQMFMVCTALRY